MVTVDNTFGPETNLYRVTNKMFAVGNADGGNFVTLKTHPEESVAPRS